MDMKPYQPQHVFVEEAVRHSAITQNVLRQADPSQVSWIESSDDLLARYRSHRPTLSRAKSWLILARHRGRFFKPCPAAQTRGQNSNVCCNYFVVNFASNCHMECSYCYLQGYLNFPHLIIHANVDDLLCELAEIIDSNPQRFLRIGTGELADSLALDAWTGYSRPLVEFFSRRHNAVLEFKTKSAQVEGLLNLDHRGRTVVSWSLNTPFIQQTEEHKTASTEFRLQAAAACVGAGYPVAFHFDPLVHYPEWEQDYRELVNEVFDLIPADSIAWVSLGALRLSRQLFKVMRSRFPGSPLPLGELIPAPDGKLRYIKPIRVEMYSKIQGWLKQRMSPRTGFYACMERPDTWEKVFQIEPPSEEAIGNQVTLGVQKEIERSEV